MKKNFKKKEQDQSKKIKNQCRPLSICNRPWTSLEEDKAPMKLTNNKLLKYLMDLHMRNQKSNPNFIQI